MKDSLGILAPGKGWGNFVSYISCFKTISENRNKKVVLIKTILFFPFVVLDLFGTDFTFFLGETFFFFLKVLTTCFLQLSSINLY